MRSSFMTCDPQVAKHPPPESGRFTIVHPLSSVGHAPGPTQHHELAMDTADRLRELAELVPILEADDADFGHWVIPAPVDGVESFGYYEFGPTGEAWRAAVGRGAWVTAGFDWRSWLETDEGRAFHQGTDAVETATPEQLGKLLTAIVRSDRFVEGSIAGAFESGLLAAIARRAAALAAE
jgi:hypothetical protein